MTVATVEKFEEKRQSDPQKKTAFPALPADDAEGGGVMNQNQPTNDPKESSLLPEALEPGPRKKVRLATTWLDGCSGCHMSFLDIDERLADLLAVADLVYGPLVDIKTFPENVDVTLVEGAVSSDEDEEKIRLIRERTAILVSFGDCAVTANVPAMRNQFKVADILNRAYVENASVWNEMPHEGVPHLLQHARPVHEFVKVDLFLPGCPPPPEAILFAVGELLEGRIPELTGKTRFGA
jgi:NAD-reducing hydrogenase small subunit